MKKYLIWKNNQKLLAATSLKVVNQPSSFNMALHVNDDAEKVIENREQLAKDFDFDLYKAVFAKQTHSDHIHKVTKEDIGKGAVEYAGAIEDCDALYTREKNICIGVFHADCVPVLIYDPIQEIVCAIHSGWQGTVKEITRKTIEVLINQEGCDPKNLLVYVGPAISQANFEVDDDVVEKVKAMSFDTKDYIYTNQQTKKSYVDNQQLNAQQCRLMGVEAGNIYVDKNCTFANQEKFFSYRRNKDCGRHMSFIMLRGEA